MRIAVTTHFDAAHYLPLHGGDCGRLHGHRWTVRVVLEGRRQASGMVLDFQILKSSVDSVIKRFDHCLINDKLQNPTAENLALYIFNELSGILTREPGQRVESVRVYETPDTWAEV